MKKGKRHEGGISYQGSHTKQMISSVNISRKQTALLRYLMSECMLKV